MSEPYENYVQYHIPVWEHLVHIRHLLHNVGIKVTFGKCKADVSMNFNYLIINVKHMVGVWNSIQTETCCLTVDKDFMAQLKLLESVSTEATLAFLLNPK